MNTWTVSLWGLLVVHVFAFCETRAWARLLGMWGQGLDLILVDPFQTKVFHCYLCGKKVLHRSSFTGVDSLCLCSSSCPLLPPNLTVEGCFPLLSGSGWSRAFQAIPLQVVPFRTPVVVKNDRWGSELFLVFSRAAVSSEEHPSALWGHTC